MATIHGLVPPPWFSVNNRIDPSLCSLSYITVDVIARIMAALGTGTLMAKVSIESAYRLILVHPDDRPLLAIQWHGDTFCDGMLPFGLHLAPKIFNTVADALEWCIRQWGVEFLHHYLDDFIVLGSPNSDQCWTDLQALEGCATCSGYPWQPTNARVLPHA